MGVLDVEPVLVWGLVVRGIGALFVIAHLSVLPQVVLLCGRHSLGSVQERLASTRRAFGLRRYLDWPTLLWLNASDTALRAYGVAGVAGGLCAIFGGPVVGVAGLAVAWLTYLTLADAAGLTFPWDVLLLEAGFLALLFLPSTLPLVSDTGALQLASSAAPSPAAAFAFHWLVARLMLGFAKVKFIGTGKGDDLYLQSFLVWLPMPNPVGWYLAHAPDWFHRASLRFMFVAEVIAPVLVLFPGWPRVVGAALLVGLMAGIHATGNWGFFNIAYIVLCIAFLDTATSAAAIFSQPVHAPDVVLFVHFGMSALLLLAFNTWVSRSWPFWPLVDVVERRLPLLRLLLLPFRLTAPFRVVNSYGVFPAKSLPPLRLAVVFEGSDDGGATWHRYPFRYLPTAAGDAPPVVAPHHPRVDQAMPYVSAGFNDASLLNGLMGAGAPAWSYARTGSIERVLQRLLAGDAVTLRLFRANPFAGRAPPSLGRVSIYALGATSLEERRQSGRWWRVQRVGALVAATGRDDDVMRETYPHPELMHPDFVWWKRRTPALRAIERARAAGKSLDDAVGAGSDITGADVDWFWRDYVPVVSARVDAVVACADRDMSLRGALPLPLPQRVLGERILERYAWLLRPSLERFRARRVPNFRFHLACCHAVLQGGRDDVERLAREPHDVITTVTKERLLALLAALRPSAVDATSLAVRWSLNNLGSELMSGPAPSVLELVDVMSARQPADEEWLPRATKDDAGHWTIDWPAA